MKDTKRQEFVDEINRYKVALAKTKSPYLKKDYQKKIRQMERDLKDYDRFHQTA